MGLLRVSEVRAISVSTAHAEVAAASVTDMQTIRDAVQRIRAEFMEMAGLRLTAAQVERLCGIDGTACQSVLDVLVSATFLRLTADGYYARATDGRFPKPHAASASEPSSAQSKKAS